MGPAVRAKSRHRGGERVVIFAFSAFLFFLAIGTPIVFVLGIAATLTLL